MNTETQTQNPLEGSAADVAQALASPVEDQTPPGDGHIHNLQRSPGQWKTANDPATDAQIAHLSTLAADTGRQINVQGLTKGQAGQLINELRESHGLAAVDHLNLGLAPEDFQ